jgi:endo-1,4-beta-xylanase
VKAIPLFFVAIAAMPARADIQCSGPAPTWVDQDKTEVQGTKQIIFPSATVKQNVSAIVYLPPGYDADPRKRYPVVYWLHGMCGHAWNGSGFVHQLDDAIRSSQAPPMIAVLVNGMSDSYYFDSPDGHWPVESMIVKDLIPYIDRSYRTIAAREARGVEGFSMGGFGAAHLAFKFPDIFGVAVIDAGAFNSLETFQKALPTISAKMFGDSDYFDQNDAMVLIRRNADSIRGRVRIRLAVGDQDGLQEAMQDLHERMKRLKIDHEYEVVPGVAHDRASFYMYLRERPFVGFYRQSLVSAISGARP